MGDPEASLFLSSESFFALAWAGSSRMEPFKELLYVIPGQAASTEPGNHCMWTQLLGQKRHLFQLNRCTSLVL